jgi:hypothetical protein
VLILASAGVALGQSLTFDLLNNTDTRINSMKALDGELVGFTPLDPGESGVFQVSGSKTCEIRVRIRFKGGEILETTAWLCEQKGRGMAFKPRPNASLQIVFREQLGL